MLATKENKSASAKIADGNHYGFAEKSLQERVASVKYRDPCGSDDRSTNRTSGRADISPYNDFDIHRRCDAVIQQSLMALKGQPWMPLALVVEMAGAPTTWQS